MGWDDVQGIIRHLLTAGGGILVSDGYINNSQLTDGVGAVIVLIGIGWSLFNKASNRAALVAAKGN